MRLIVTADLHYGHRPEGDASARAMAQEICSLGADALVLAGDNAAFEPSLFDECFGLFDDFGGRKFTFCGNHDLWTREGDSLDIYNELFPQMATRGGFEYLEGQPTVFGPVGLVGSVGWYDYSFRDDSLDIEERYYRQKYHPRMAFWNDGRFIRMPLSDPEFNEMVVQQLEAGIQSIYRQVETIVAVTHLVAFDCMLIRKPGKVWNFCNAFIGSRGLGEMLLKYPKVNIHLCGHTHWPSRHQVGHLQTINIGSTYEEKRYEILEL